MVIFISETAEYMTWDYTERLVLDRESETLEHIQSIGSGCVVSRKYYVQGGVEGLLDDIDADDLFGEIEGNPDDVVDNPLETKDYTITVDFKKGPQRVIHGPYDKKALPEFWRNFADSVWGFLCVSTEWAKYSILRSTRRSSAAEPITFTVAWNLTRATKAIITLLTRTIFLLATM